MIAFYVYRYGFFARPKRVTEHHIVDAEEAKEYAKTVLLKTVNTASVAVEVDGAEVAHCYNYKR